MLQAQDPTPCRGSRHLQLMGHRVCNKGFIKLIGLGKLRFKNLMTAVKNGEECPYDGRYVIKAPREPSQKWERVHHYLTSLCMEAAEPIPDGLNSNKRPRHGAKKRDAPNLNRDAMKHFPYNTISEYWNRCKAANPDLNISRKLFCGESHSNLYQLFFKVHTLDSCLQSRWSPAHVTLI